MSSIVSQELTIRLDNTNSQTRLYQYLGIFHKCKCEIDIFELNKNIQTHNYPQIRNSNYFLVNAYNNLSYMNFF